jgi:uncharacterized protein YndB with AHSA1/START domain
VSVVEVSEVIDAPPQAVWDVVADPKNLPMWDHHIYEVKGVPKTGLRPGTEYTTGVKFMGARAHASARVLELEPARYSKIELHGMIDGIVETWLEPMDGGRTRLRHRVAYRFKGGPIGEVAARAIRLLGATALLRKGVQAQKEQVERARP